MVQYLFLVLIPARLRVTTAGLIPPIEIGCNNTINQCIGLRGSQSNSIPGDMNRGSSIKREPVVYKASTYEKNKQPATYSMFVYGGDEILPVEEALGYIARANPFDPANLGINE